MFVVFAKPPVHPKGLLLVALGLIGACTKDSGLVTFDAPPSVVILEPADDATFASGEPITFRARIVDDGPTDELIVEWTSDVDGALTSSDVVDPDGNLTFETANLTGGNNVVTLRATDGALGQDEASVLIHIELVPEVPSIVVDHPQPDEDGLEDTPFVFAATVTDRQDNPEDLQIELSSDPGGLVCTMIPDSAGSGTCSAILPVGPYLLSYKVTDTDGNEQSAPAAYLVVSEGDYDADGDGYTPNQADCLDTNPYVYPGAPEECDGLDNDCNEVTGIDVGSDCYDDDGDGYCEEPPCVNASSNEADCDDDDAQISDDAEEIRNGKDDDCDTLIDDGTVAYDDDADGYCEEPPCVNTKSTEPDCDDAVYAIAPGAKEVCADDIDNDCDTLLNEKNATGCKQYYLDNDGDTYGTGTTTECWCEPGEAPRTALNNKDCDDNDAAIHPDSVDETRNGLDDDCDGKIDEGTTAYDDDADGYCEEPPCVNSKSTQIDCDDSAYAVKPGAKEVCGDDIDNDCDTLLNEKDATGCTQFYMDADGDGFGTTARECWCPPGGPDYSATNSKDCNDKDGGINPSVTAETRNGVDDDCDAKIDEGTTAYDDDADGYCEEPPCVNSTKTAADCNDASYTIKPLATEVCGDGIDNDCDTLLNEKGATGCKQFYLDADGDGFGTTAVECWCDAGSGDYDATNSKDCNDKNSAVNPSVTAETRNGLDDDCDGKIDEGTTAYDDDADGYCEEPPCINSTKTVADCNDASYAIKPLALEVCGDNIDNDCDTLLNEKDASGCKQYYADVDGDGFGSTTNRQCWCSPGGTGYTATTNTDCYDTNANARPGQTGWFTTPRGDASYDYNCDVSQEKQYRGVTSGCKGDYNNLDCDVGTAGWQGSEKACGQPGLWLASCGTDVDFVCLAFCSGSGCAACLTCEPQPTNLTQGCR